MLNYEEALAFLKTYLKDLEDQERAREDMLHSTQLEALKDERHNYYNELIAATRGRLNAILEEFTLFPPRHLRCADPLKAFHQNAPYEKSVFIMTKYPNSKSKKAPDVKLREIIAAVKAAVATCQHSPRVAFEVTYHPELWANVEIHLLGCSRGIAIIEDKHSKELNPNVAMEWGWMVGMGRSVLYLVEKNFKHARADWGGLIKEEFDWNGDLKDIGAAVHKFLGCTLQH